ncbi:MAG: hypothetical protein GY801_03240 [bacterium]|nr:hypothetical protein [bacterium]
MKKRLVTCMAMILLAGMAIAQVEAVDSPSAAKIPSEVTLFKNVKVFNGTEDTLHDVDVLLVKNKIYKIAKDIPITGTWEIDVKTGGAQQIKGPETGGMVTRLQPLKNQKKSRNRLR